MSGWIDPRGEVKQPGESILPPPIQLNLPDTSRTAVVEAYRLIHVVEAYRARAEAKLAHCLARRMEKDRWDLHVPADLPDGFRWIAYDVLEGRPSPAIDWIVSQPAPEFVVSRRPTPEAGPEHV